MVWEEKRREAFPYPNYKHNGGAMLAIQQQKLVKHSLKFFTVFALIFLATTYAERVKLSVFVGGLILGCLWAICLPILWKRNMELAHSFLTVGLAVLISTRDGGSWSGFQLIALGLAFACFAWYLFRRRILYYLQRGL